MDGRGLVKYDWRVDLIHGVVEGHFYVKETHEVENIEVSVVAIDARSGDYLNYSYKVVYMQEERVKEMGIE